MAALRAWVGSPDVVERYRMAHEDGADWAVRYLPWRDAVKDIVAAIDAELDEIHPLIAADRAAARRVLRAITVLRGLIRDPVYAYLRTSVLVLDGLIALDADFDAAEMALDVLAAIPRLPDLPAANEAETRCLVVAALWSDARVADVHRELPALQAAAKRAGFRGVAAFAARIAAEVKMREGNVDAAIEAFTEALRLRRDLTAEEVAEAAQRVAPVEAYLAGLGRAAGRAGRFALAEATLTELVERRSAAGTPNLVDALRQLGITYHYAGDNARAESTFRRAADVAERFGRAEEAASLRTQAGVMAMAASEGRSGPDRALPFAGEIEDDRSAVDATNAVIGLLVSGQDRQAADLGERVLGWALDHSDADIELSLRNSLGAAYGRLGRLEDARRHLIAGIRLADKARRYRASIDLRRNLAEAYFVAERVSEGMMAMRAAVNLAPLVWHAAGSSQHRQDVLAGLADVLDRFAFLLVLSGDHESFVAVTELARSRNAAEWIAAEQILGGASDPHGAAAAMRALRAADVELEMSTLDGRAGEGKMAGLFARREQAAGVVDGLLPGAVSLRGASENYEQRTRVAIAAFVTAERVVIALFATATHVCWALVTAAGYQGGFVPWSRDERVANMTAVMASDWVDDDDPDAGVRAVAATTGLIAARLPDLVEALRAARPGNVTVIPHEELVFLPFWSLADLVPGVRSLSLAPSLDVLDLCTNRVRDPDGPTLIVPDSTGELTFAACEAATVSAVRPGAHVPGGVADLFAAAATSSVLHVCGHGLFDAANPYRSGFLAVPGDEGPGRYWSPASGVADEPGPGAVRVVTVAECLGRLDLSRCALTVLSACESGVPRVHAAGEMTGLPNALLVAGSRTVIASMWPTVDEASAALIGYFYECWDGGSPAAALAQARRRLRTATAEELRARLGPDADLPAGEHPFAEALYSDAFLAFGAP